MAHSTSRWPHCVQIPTLAYTVAQSSTESEFMLAAAAGRATLYFPSILWDLDVPQFAATMMYEDNDSATAMANAGKPTSRSRHIDIKYYAIQEWVERDLIVLSRIDTSLNICPATSQKPFRAYYSIVIGTSIWDMCHGLILQNT